MKAISAPVGENAGKQAVRAHLGQHRRAPAVHVDDGDLVRAAPGERQRDARAEHPRLAGERLDHVVGELVDGVARVGRPVALGEHRAVAAGDDEEASLEHAARDLHLDDRLRADLRPERRREPQPLGLELGGEGSRIEQLEQAGDVHVLGHRLAGAGISLGARERQLQHLDAGAGELHGREILVASGGLGPHGHVHGHGDDHDRQQRRDGEAGHLTHWTLIPCMVGGGGGTLPVSLAASTQASSTKLLVDDLASLTSPIVPSGAMRKVISGRTGI